MIYCGGGELPPPFFTIFAPLLVFGGYTSKQYGGFLSAYQIQCIKSEKYLKSEFR